MDMALVKIGSYGTLNFFRDTDGEIACGYGPARWDDEAPAHEQPMGLIAVADGETVEGFIEALRAACATPPSLPEAARDAIAAMRDGGLEDDADALERALEAAK